MKFGIMGIKVVLTYLFAVISVHIKILGTVYVPSLSVFTSYAPLLANFTIHT